MRMPKARPRLATAFNKIALVKNYRTPDYQIFFFWLRALIMPYQHQNYVPLCDYALSKKQTPAAEVKWTTGNFNPVPA